MSMKILKFLENPRAQAMARRGGALRELNFFISTILMLINLSYLMNVLKLKG